MYNILIADDEECLTKLFKKVLEVSGYNVTTVSNGKECLEEWGKIILML